MNDYEICPECLTYAEGRASVLPQAMVDHSRVSGETGREVLDRFMGGVHERHLSGLSLDVSA